MINNVEPVQLEYYGFYISGHLSCYIERTLLRIFTLVPFHAAPSLTVWEAPSSSQGPSEFKHELAEAGERCCRNLSKK